MNLYVICALLAGAFWGSVGIFATQMRAAGVGSAGMMILRCGFAGLCFALLLLWKNPRLFLFRKKDAPLIFGVGILGQLCFSLCYYTAIPLVGISTACILLYLSPIFVMLLARVFFRDKISKSGIAALFLCVIGCALVSGFGGTLNGKGVLCGVGCAVCFALINIFTRELLRRGYNGWTINFYTCALAAVGGIVLFGLQEPVAYLSGGAENVLYGVLSGFINGFLPYLFFSKALSGLDSGRVAIYGSTEPVTATLVGVLIFGEKLGWIGFAGIIMVLGSIVLMNRPEKSA